MSAKHPPTDHRATPGSDARWHRCHASEAALDALRQPVWLLQADGLVCQRNRVAASHARVTAWVVMRSHKVHAVGQLTPAEWSAALRRADAGTPVSFGVWHWSAGRLHTAQAHLDPLMAAHAQHADHAPWGRARVVLTITPCEHDHGMRLREQAVASRYSLTEAETFLMSQLRAGGTLDDVAQQRGVRLSTVRTQLRHLIEKLGVRRQVDVVRLVGGL